MRAFGAVGKSLFLLQAVLVKSLSFHEGDASALLKDPFGQMEGTIHRRVRRRA